MQAAPSMSTAICYTTAAVLDLVVAFLMVAGMPLHYLHWFLVCEAVLIGVAVWAWVQYFKKYVAFALLQHDQTLNATGNRPASEASS